MAGPDIRIVTNASFELDSLPLATFEHVPELAQDRYLYNVLLFGTSELDNTEHTLVMSVIHGESPSRLLFDYAVYT